MKNKGLFELRDLMLKNLNLDETQKTKSVSNLLQKNQKKIKQQKEKLAKQLTTINKNINETEAKKKQIITKRKQIWNTYESCFV